MTYPPQQPEPYGPQPGAAAPPSGPQPGAYTGGGQHYGGPGHYEQGQYDRPDGLGGGPGGTRQFPQPDTYDQQQSGYGQYDRQGGFPGGEPPRKKTGLIIGIAVAAVAVIGGVIALIVLNSGGAGDQAQPTATSQNQGPGRSPGTPGSSKSPTSRSKPPSSSSSAPTSAAGAGPAPGGKANVQELADGVIAAYNSGDGKSVADSVCRSVSTKSEIQMKSGLRLESTGSLKQNGDTAKMPITATVDGKTESGYLGFKKESGLWCFSGPSQN